MGRKKELGLSYFPFDIDTFSDIKIRKLIKYQGGKAVVVYTLLLCLIYKGGYYMRWDKELPFIISEQTGFEEAYIQEVIKNCLALGLFSKELFDSDGILTSKGIQYRYQDIMNLCRRSGNIFEYKLISSEEKPISSEVIPISSEEKPINSAKSTQRKEKKIEIKKESKKKTTETAQRFRPPSIVEVSAYIAEKHYSVDAEVFFAFYESKNWFVGRNKMRDWHAALVTWQKREHPEPHQVSRNASQQQPSASIIIPDPEQELSERKAKWESERKRIIRNIQAANANPHSLQAGAVRNLLKGNSLQYYDIDPAMIQLPPADEKLK